MDNHLTDNKVLELIAEMLIRKREIIRNFDVKIVKYIDKIIVNLIPSSRSTKLFKNYLHYLKAVIFFKHGQINKAREIIEDLLSNINETEIYKTYHEINDLLLEIK